MPEQLDDGMAWTPIHKPNTKLLPHEKEAMEQIVKGVLATPEGSWQPTPRK